MEAFWRQVSPAVGRCRARWTWGRACPSAGLRCRRCPDRPDQRRLRNGTLSLPSTRVNGNPGLPRACPPATKARTPRRAMRWAKEPPALDSLMPPVRGDLAPTESRPDEPAGVPVRVPEAKTSLLNLPRGMAGRRHLSAHKTRGEGASAQVGVVSQGLEAKGFGRNVDANEFLTWGVS